jgi:hypothetical protein
MMNMRFGGNDRHDTQTISVYDQNCMRAKVSEARWYSLGRLAEVFPRRTSTALLPSRKQPPLAPAAVLFALSYIHPMLVGAGG